MEKQDLESGKKLVSDSAVQNSKDIEVKFIPPDPRNGDAKIDIENLKCVFTGMGKEELMKYADDPFWVRIRWLLFILFWFVWIAMLVGAVGIIVLAPKCTSEPKSWWETSPTYKINVRTYAGGKLKDIEAKLDYIKDLGVSNIVVTSVLKSMSEVEADDFIEDFESVNPAVGTTEDFETFVKAAKAKDLKVQLAFVPNHSSDKHPFFQKSLNKEEPYTNYYVWKSQNGSDSSGNPAPPNSRISVNGGSAWTWNDVRREFYLHQFGAYQPDFNFQDPSVVEYFKKVFAYWLNKGVSGFYLEKVGYMLEDMKSSGVTSTGTEISETDNYLTIKSPELVSILEGWKSTVSNGSGVLTVGGLISKTGDSVKLNLHPQELSENFSATNLSQVVNLWLNSSSWPVWQFSCTKNREPKTCWKPEVVNGLQMVSMLLPGTPVIKAGEELNVGTIKPLPRSKTSSSETPAANTISDDSSQLISVNSPLKMFKKLTDARDSPAFMHGDYEVKVLKDSVFVYTRIKSGSPGYIVVFNPSVETVAVNLSEMKNIPVELTIEAWTPPVIQIVPPMKPVFVHREKDVSVSTKIWMNTVTRKLHFDQPMFSGYSPNVGGYNPTLVDSNPNPALTVSVFTVYISANNHPFFSVSKLNSLDVTIPPTTALICSFVPKL